MMPASLSSIGSCDGDEQSIEASMEEIHRAETTAALLDSGLVDIKSGDCTDQVNLINQDEAGCC